MNKHLLRFTSLILVPALSADPAVANALGTGSDISIAIPARWGRITDAYGVRSEFRVSRSELTALPGSSNAEPGTRNPKLVILIQDLHGNPGVQRNIAEILKHVARRASWVMGRESQNGDPGLTTHDSRLRTGSRHLTVFVEGTSGPFDVGILRNVRNPWVKAHGIQELLGEQTITGSEIAAIESPEPLHLWGVDDKALYLENLEAFYQASLNSPAPHPKHPVWRTYYQIAEKRNLPLALNMLTHLELLAQTTASPRVVALVSGGYHTEGIARILKANQVPYVVIAPAVTSLGQEHRYATNLQNLARQAHQETMPSPLRFAVGTGFAFVTLRTAFQILMATRISTWSQATFIPWLDLVALVASVVIMVFVEQFYSHTQSAGRFVRVAGSFMERPLSAVFMTTNGANNGQSQSAQPPQPGSSPSNTPPLSPQAMRDPVEKAFSPHLRDFDKSTILGILAAYLEASSDLHVRDLVRIVKRFYSQEALGNPTSMVALINSWDDFEREAVRIIKHLTRLLTARRARGSIFRFLFFASYGAILLWFGTLTGLISLKIFGGLTVIWSACASLAPWTPWVIQKVQTRKAVKALETLPQRFEAMAKAMQGGDLRTATREGYAVLYLIRGITNLLRNRRLSNLLDLASVFFFPPALMEENPLPLWLGTIEWMAELGDPRVLPLLRSIAAHHSHADVRRAATDAISKITPPAASPPGDKPAGSILYWIIQALRGSPEPAAWERGVGLLGTMLLEIPLIVWFVTSPHPAQFGHGILHTLGLGTLAAGPSAFLGAGAALFVAAVAHVVLEIIAAYRARGALPSAREVGRQFFTHLCDLSPYVFITLPVSLPLRLIYIVLTVSNHLRSDLIRLFPDSSLVRLLQSAFSLRQIPQQEGASRGLSVVRRTVVLAGILGLAGLAVDGGRQAVKEWIEIPALKSELIKEGKMTELLGLHWNDPEDPRIRSAEATREMTKALIKEKPDFLAREKLTVLYPGSGNHVTPLEIAHDLIRQGLIQEATFIYTEIEPKTLNDLRQTLQTLVTEGFYTNLSERTQAFDKGKEVTFTMKFQGKPITVLFALNRSGEEHYWLPEYVERANVVYHHDLDEPTVQKFMTELWADFYGDGKDRGDLVLMSEDFLRDGVMRPDTQKHLGMIAWDLVGSVTRVPHGFGHRTPNLEEDLRNPSAQSHTERGQYKFSHANLVRFDKRLLRSQSPIKDVVPDSALADFLSVVAMGHLDATVFKNSLRPVDTSDNSGVIDWLVETALVAETIIQSRIEAGSPRRARWLVGMLRFHWAVYQISERLQQEQSFGAWLSENSPWLRQEVARAMNQLPALASFCTESGGSRRGVSAVG